MILSQVLDLFTKFAVIGGGIWAVWGVIIVASGLRDPFGRSLVAV